MAKSTKAGASSLEEPCWSCGGTRFTSSATSHHMGRQTICADCYEPQDAQDDYYDDEDMYF